MAKHPTSSRVHRESHGPDDAFVSTVRRMVEWAKAHDRQLTIGAVAVAVLAVLAVYYIGSQRRTEASAASEFAQVQQTVASGNPDLAIRDLQDYLARFGATDAARPARLLLADILLGEDRPAEAVDALGDLPDELDDPFGVAGARLLAAAEEALGNPDRAVQLYQRVADNARFAFQRRESLGDAARVRLQNGDPDAAADLYEEVLETYDEGQAGRGYYEMWLAEARAQADEGSAAPTTAADSQPTADTAG